MVLRDSRTWEHQEIFNGEGYSAKWSDAAVKQTAGGRKLLEAGNQLFLAGKKGIVATLIPTCETACKS